MQRIRLKFTNGLNFADGVREILAPLFSEYEFVDSPTPDFIIFGPYGTDIPPPGGPVRIGYFCENMRPDLTICDWAFGVPYEEEVNSPRYKRIDWHGIFPEALIRNSARIEEMIDRKARFCNFLYSNLVPYRERFFRELSKYKRIDAPARSMNNMDPLDEPNAPDRWATKRRFLSKYKFTIAFENYSYPGYHTEKLLDPMLAGSLPIYLGNPKIERHFNCRSFVNAREYIKGICPPVVEILEKNCKLKMPSASGGHSFNSRAERKLVFLGQRLKMHLQCWNFSDLIEQIVAIDRNDDLYARYLAEPWFDGNQAPSNSAAIERWRTIFRGQASF